jgi:polyisoprenoid-binding protein YceI
LASSPISTKLALNAAEPARSSPDVTVRTGSVATHNDKLEEHLRSKDFFDTASHPTAVFRSTRVEPTGKKTARVSGNFTVHGVTRSVTLDIVFNGSGINPVNNAYTVGFSAEGTIKRTEFGMNYLAPAVGDEVKLLISGEFNRKD